MARASYPSALLSLVVLGNVLLCTCPAAAVERRGFTIGVRLAGEGTQPTGGLAEHTNGFGGVAGRVSLGGFFNQTASLSFDAALHLTFGPDRHLVMGSLGLVLGLYPSERFHLDLGAAFARVSGGDDAQDKGLMYGGPGVSLLAGLGYDIVQTTGFGLALVASLETVILPAADGDSPPAGTPTPVVTPDVESSLLLFGSAGLRFQWY